MFKTKTILIALVTLSPALFAEGSLEQFSGETMGTTYKVKYSLNSKSEFAHETAQIKNGVEQLLKNLNAQMSTYIQSSEISRFNKLSPRQEMKISAGFAEVVRAALKISTKSSSYFDPTVGPLLRLYAHGYDGEKNLQEKIPSPKKIEATLALIGMGKLELTTTKKPRKLMEFSLSKSTAGLELDLSAIAKGYGVDIVYRYLSSLGLSSILVEVGGELRGSAENSANSSPGKPALWRVGIEKPAAERSERPMAILPLSDMSVATSGNYRNFRLIEGKRIGHVINPKSGQYVQSNIASVTVLDKSCMEADAWATGLLAMPEEALRKTVAKHNLKALWAIYKAKPKFLGWVSFWGKPRIVVHRSRALVDYLQKFGSQNESSQQSPIKKETSL